MRLHRWLYYVIHGAPATGALRNRPRRGPERNERYRAWIRSMPCIFCGTTRGIQAAHTGADGGMPQKSSDYSCLPACFYCHHEFDSGVVSGREFAASKDVEVEMEVARLNRYWFRFEREIGR